MLDHVIYPPQYDPGISPIYALNELDVKASAAVVWQLLVDAENWSRWFPPEDKVTILSGGRELALGTRYSRVWPATHELTGLLRDHEWRKPAWKQRYGSERICEPIEVRDQSVKQGDELRHLLVRKPSHCIAIASEQGRDGLRQACQRELR